mmetsp:Transcript_2697/g.6702  ORF Transcript_2697/g.6702 Transcript_2697/m.6702 type:complete len:657 (+) Transcript_2697:106-2076(+)
MHRTVTRYTLPLPAPGRSAYRQSRVPYGHGHGGRRGGGRGRVGGGGQPAEMCVGYKLVATAVGGSCLLGGGYIVFRRGRLLVRGGRDLVLDVRLELLRILRIRRLQSVQVEDVGTEVARGRLDELGVVLDGAWLGKHGSHVREVDEEEEGGDREDVDAHVREAEVVTERAGEEDRERDDGAEGAARADHAGDHAERGARDVRHHAVVEALCGLDEDREEDHEGEGGAGHVLVGDALAAIKILAGHNEALGRGEDHDELVGEVELRLDVVGGQRGERAAEGDGGRLVDELAVDLGLDLAHLLPGVADLGPARDALGVLGARSTAPRCGVVLKLVRRLHAGGEQAEEDAERALQGLHDPGRPEAAAHAVALVRPVGEDAAERAHAKVHQAEARGEDARDGGREAMVPREVPGGDVVHRELHAEARAVGEGEDPRVDIREADLEHRAALALLLDAAVLQLAVVAVGEVLARQGHGHGEDVHEEGDEVREAPRAVLVLPRGGHEEQEEERHRQVGDAAAKVAPAGRCGIGDADDAPRKHLGAPRLRADERGQREADQAAANDETGSVSGEHHADDAGSADRHEHEHALARAEDVHHRAHDGAEHDGARHAGDLAAGDVLLGQVERVRLLHVRTQRRRREGAHEPGEEVEPRGVESAHVRL